MKKITGLLLLLLLMALAGSCSSIRQFRYMSKGKAPKGTFRTEIPFELNNGLIIIKVKLNGSDKEFEFMVDSGAPASVIFKEAFETSKAETVMTYGVSDSQGNKTQSAYVLLDVTIGNSIFKDIFTAYSADPNEFITCIAPGGIIGADLMQTANWEIDFVHKKLIISDLKSSLPDLAGYQKVSFTKRSPFGNLPWLNVLPGLTVDLKVNDQVFKDVYIDLGSSGSITLPKNEVTAKLFEHDLKEVLTGYSTFGLLGAEMDTTFYYYSPNIYMGPLNLNNHSIDISNHNQSLIGTAIFSDYSMIIDFRKEDLYFKPIGAAEKKSTDEKELGFHLLYDSKSATCYVANIYEGSSAALAGLQLTDTIVEINQQQLPVFTDFCEFRSWSRQMISQDQLLIKTKRDDELIRIEKGIIPKR